MISQYIIKVGFSHRIPRGLKNTICTNLKKKKFLNKKSTIAGTTFTYYYAFTFILQDQKVCFGCL